MDLTLVISHVWFSLFPFLAPPLHKKKKRKGREAKETDMDEGHAYFSVRYIQAHSSTPVPADCAIG